MLKKRLDVETVLMDVPTSIKDITVVIGYIIRHDNLCRNHNPLIPNDWWATRELLNPSWEGGFSTRKEAREYLEKIHEM
jgi:hypothetical protein